MVCRFWFCVLGVFSTWWFWVVCTRVGGVLFRFGFGSRFGAGYDDYVLVFASVGVTSVGVGWFGYKGCDMLVLWGWVVCLCFGRVCGCGFGLLFSWLV